MPNNSNAPTSATAEGIAFPHLTAPDLEQLRLFGTTCSYEDGQVIFSAGGDAVDLFIVESGAMEILNPAQDNRSVVTHGPGQFSGDIDLLTRRPPLVTGVARGRTHLIRISDARIREGTKHFRISVRFSHRRPGTSSPVAGNRRSGIEVVGPGKCDTCCPRVPL
jgi:CRP-like cAMP-binding protein